MFDPDRELYNPLRDDLEQDSEVQEALQILGAPRTVKPEPVDHPPVQSNRDHSRGRGSRGRGRGRAFRGRGRGRGPAFIGRGSRGRGRGREFSDRAGKKRIDRPHIVNEQQLQNALMAEYYDGITPMELRRCMKYNYDVKKSLIKRLIQQKNLSSHFLRQWLETKQVWSIIDNSPKIETEEQLRERLDEHFEDGMKLAELVKTIRQQYDLRGLKSPKFGVHYVRAWFAMNIDENKNFGQETIKNQAKRDLAKTDNCKRFPPPPPKKRKPNPWPNEKPKSNPWPNVP